VSPSLYITIFDDWFDSPSSNYGNDMEMKASFSNYELSFKWHVTSWRALKLCSLLCLSSWTRKWHNHSLQILIYLKATFLNDLLDGNISQIFNFKSKKKNVLSQIPCFFRRKNHQKFQKKKIEKKFAIKFLVLGQIIYQFLLVQTFFYKCIIN
jgi:hypothetical protein